MDTAIQNTSFQGWVCVPGNRGGKSGVKFLLAGALDPKCLHLLIYEIDAASHSPEAEHLKKQEGWMIHLGARSKASWA